MKDGGKSQPSPAEALEKGDIKRSVRREIWIHPLDGRRTQRTTASSPNSMAARGHSDDEDLARLPSIEVKLECLET